MLFADLSDVVSYSTFAVAHWIFAFSYYAISLRVELTVKKLPPERNDKRLNTLNVLVILLTVLIAALAEWLLVSNDLWGVIFGVLELFALILGCIFLVIGLHRL